MAASCRKFARTVLWKGWNILPNRPLRTRCSTDRLSPLCVDLRGPYRPLHLSSGLMLSTSTKTEPQKTTDNQPKEKKAAVEEEEYEEPEYIPKRKAKNPMRPIAYAWMIGLPAGIIGFILAKREVDKNRLKQLKIRQRMKRSNEGEYEGSRYGNTATGS